MLPPTLSHPNRLLDSRQAARSIQIDTVQQEISVIIRPQAATYAFCDRVGCQFVAYGALLGGLLSDRYIGQERHPWQYVARKLTLSFVMVNQQALTRRGTQQAGYPCVPENGWQVTHVS